ncbi:MAG: insulinase family protein [Candidatus Saccharibacteria bacterium]|nr:insulinase family protein [Candidatus Saccharibacteria bacterium]
MKTSDLLEKVKKYTLTPNYSTLFKKSQVFRHHVEEITLKNGAKGLFIDVPNASVMNIKIQFRAGMRYAKSPDIYEIAHLAEHLAFGANAKYKSEQAYEADFTKNGAYHNAWTSDFSVCYEAECADFEWERILNLQRVAICQPKFNEDELKSEKGNVKSELTGYMNDYYRLIWPKIQRAIGEGQPLDLKDRLKTLNNIQIKDLREHHRRTHVAGNMRFVISGRLKQRRYQILQNLEQWELKPGERFEPPRDELHSSDAILIRRKDASNLTFGFTWVTPRRLNTTELVAMDSLNHLLTGSMNSRSTTAISPLNSSWDFDGEVNLESAEELFTLIQTELTSILNGQISDAEIAAIKAYCLGRFQIGVQTVSQIADYYSASFFNNETYALHDLIPDFINTLDKNTMVDLAREFIDAGIHAMAAVSSTDKPTITNLASKLDL